MKRRKNLPAKNIMIVITLICILAIIFTWQSRSSITPIEKSFSYVVIPIQNGVNVVGDWLGEKVQFVKDIRDLENINETLQTELNELEYANKILQMDKTELVRLRELYTLDKRYADYPKIGAQVIGKDPSNWYKMFMINKGEKDGLKVNMVVLSGEGLVGHITEVGPNYAKVQSIINDTCNVSAKILRTSDLCIVKGDQTLVNNEALCRVDYIEDRANIVIGDEVVTSHLGSIYPPGILIGTINQIDTNSPKMTRTATLQPAVDFKHLEEVLVINQVWEDGLTEAADVQ
ncbi:MAG: rod shape-determining protein MreC [Firmicutes bacterium HGW-Firmicutes-7]|nr:MAG: rod shape-determining protein MreC [Firmicutes bacterium HGW-Firmicutes-7]